MDNQIPQTPKTQQVKSGQTMDAESAANQSVENKNKLLTTILVLLLIITSGVSGFFGYMYFTLTSKQNVENELSPALIPIPANYRERKPLDLKAEMGSLDFVTTIPEGYKAEYYPEDNYSSKRVIINQQKAVLEANKWGVPLQNDHYIKVSRTLMSHPYSGESVTHFSSVEDYLLFVDNLMNNPPLGELPSAGYYFKIKGAVDKSYEFTNDLIEIERHSCIDNASRIPDSQSEKPRCILLATLGKNISGSSLDNQYLYEFLIVYSLDEKSDESFELAKNVILNDFRLLR